MGLKTSEIIALINSAKLTLTDVKTTDYTASVGEFVQVDTTVGPNSITIYAPPAVGRVIGDRFGVIVSRANSLDSSLIRDLTFDLNGGVPAGDSFPQTSIRVSSFRAVWVVTSLTGGKFGDLPVWTNEEVNDDNQRDLVGKFGGSSLTTANDTPTTIFSFFTGNNLCQMHLSLLARGDPFAPTGYHAQFVIDALFWNDAGVVTVEWFTFSVANIPPALTGIIVDSVSVGSEVFVRVTGLSTTSVVWHVVRGDVRGGL